ncbi:MAG: DUF3427 domain-containing protein, partial [Gemmatimonadales bacterium]
HMELDRVASERVIESIKRSVPTRWKEKAAELASLEQENPGLSLGAFLAASGLDLEDIYAGSRSWSDLCEQAGLQLRAIGPHEKILRRACGRLVHVDDSDRLDMWRQWLRIDNPSDISLMPERERRLVRMLLSQLLDQIPDNEMTLMEGVELLSAHPQVRAELVELFDVLSDKIAHLSTPLHSLPDMPLRVMARYTRLEILAACTVAPGVVMPLWQTGVYYAKGLPADLCAFTLDKTSGGFSPTTRYRDYAINRNLIHWESQSGTRAASATGQRYQEHKARGSHILLFARNRSDERAFYFLGPATYVSHEGELPMAITWKLQYPLPGDLFAAFAAAVA